MSGRWVQIANSPNEFDEQKLFDATREFMNDTMFKQVRSAVSILGNLIVLCSF